MKKPDKLNAPFGELFARLQKNNTSRKELQQAVQLAIQIEFMTIPAYLTALYSISDVTCDTYQILRSVVMEEMFHVNQASNLLVAIGGQPKFTGTAVPTYPNYLPHSNPNTMPYIGLTRASVSVFSDVFAAIEEPAEHNAPAQSNHYDTIAQAYKSIEDALEAYDGKEPLFRQNPKARQRTNIYPGKFGGKPIEVLNMKDAKAAILEITEQGEGSVPPSGALVPVQPFGAYNHYGERTDGTYGPILGTPLEMSHFKKFRTIALDTANFPATYPILSNPQYDDYHNPLVIKAARAFDCAYSIMLDALERSFYKPANQHEPDLFYAVVLPLMHQMMPSLARILMNTPTRPNGDPASGPNGTPVFLYTPNCSLSQLASLMAEVIKLAAPTANENNNLIVVVNQLQEALNSIQTK